MKVFTVDDANRTLPLVSRIVQDIVTQYSRWQDRTREFELLTAGARLEKPDQRADALQVEMQALAAEIEGYVQELIHLSVEFKGFDTGLVDFPGEIDGRPIYLCWQLGEQSVQYWHEKDTGFAGRQPLSPHLIQRIQDASV